MRAALWLLALFAVAVAVALFAGSNQGTVTVFWPPYRVDLSLNLVLIAVLGLFFTLHTALRALGLLFALPAAARRWRVQHQERAMHLGLLDALSHLVAGRYIRARKAAQGILLQETVLARSDQPLPYAERLRAVSHLLVAESAHALQDREARESHLQQALGHVAPRDGQETRDGLLLSAARWSLEDREARAAIAWLDELPQGTARRTIALKLRFKAARRAGRTLLALETARLLTKHRAFSAVAGASIMRALALELLDTSHDGAQLQAAWAALDKQEREMPDVAIHAAQRLTRIAGDVTTARQWLVPVWEHMMRQPGALVDAQRLRLIHALEHSFSTGDVALDSAWLGRIETAQMANPRDASLQYLAGAACKHLKLWGKAQQLLTQAVARLEDGETARSALRHLGELAEQRQDPVAAADAYRRAAHTGYGMGPGTAQKK